MLVNVLCELENMYSAVVARSNLQVSIRSNLTDGVFQVNYTISDFLPASSIN